MERVRIFVSGNVHGVGFRYSTVEKANELGLTGWVRNAEGGRVEIIAEGDKNSLESLISWCGQGPTFSKVENVQVFWEKATGEFPDFDLKY